MNLFNIIYILALLLCSLTAKAQSFLDIKFTHQFQNKYKLDITNDKRLEATTKAGELDFAKIYNLKPDTSYVYNDREDTVVDITYYPLGSLCQRSYNIPDSIF